LIDSHRLRCALGSHNSLPPSPLASLPPFATLAHPHTLAFGAFGSVVRPSVPVSLSLSLSLSVWQLSHALTRTNTHAPVPSASVSKLIWIGHVYILQKPSPEGPTLPFHTHTHTDAPSPPHFSLSPSTRPCPRYTMVGCARFTLAARCAAARPARRCSSCCVGRCVWGEPWGLDWMGGDSIERGWLRLIESCDAASNRSINRHAYTARCAHPRTKDAQCAVWSVHNSHPCAILCVCESVYIYVCVYVYIYKCINVCVLPVGRGRGRRSSSWPRRSSLPSTGGSPSPVFFRILGDVCVCVCVCE
jgi:hypothetical protein